MTADELIEKLMAMLKKQRAINSTLDILVETGQAQPALVSDVWHEGRTLEAMLLVLISSVEEGGVIHIADGT